MLKRINMFKLSISCLTDASLLYLFFVLIYNVLFIVINRPSLSASAFNLFNVLFNVFLFLLLLR